MGFHAYSSPYDWSRIAGFKATAKTVPGGMIDLSVGSPVDPVPSSVQQALVAGADAPNAHGYPVTAGTADLKAAIDTWFRELRGVDLKSINAAAVPTVGSKEAVALIKVWHDYIHAAGLSSNSCNYTLQILIMIIWGHQVGVFANWI